MRKGHHFAVVVLGGLFATAGVVSAGCIDLTGDYYTPLTDPSLATWNDGGSDGGDSGPPPSCIPSLNVGAIDDTCGLFVSSSMGSDTTGMGTKAAPYQTLGKALSTAGTKPVYACGETFMVTQSVTLSAKVDLYGALACAKGWVYDGTNKTQIQADATMTPIPLTLASGASGSSVHDFVITAADAKMAGGSSIAVLDDHADLTLENVDVAAGAGKDGTPGATQMQVMTPMTANGSAGTDDAMCMNTGVIMGGGGGTNTCNGMKTDGGNGGKGVPASTGDNGGSGLPMMMSSNGGAGQTKTTQCQPGQQGAQGSTGTAGTGAHGIGDVSATGPSPGYQAPVATLGGPGGLGQGGGGGGAALPCDAPTDMFSGPSGGGGGGGGCGGMPGDLGTSGGSSIGIISLGANLTLTNVTITARTGGGGGLGGNGQLGGNGGQQGNQGASGACPGGPGGQGGRGGSGGGGAGGHSIGIAIKGGTAPDLSHATITPGSAGMGGGGGDMDMTAMTKGDDGKACHVLDFTKQTCATM